MRQFDMPAIGGPKPHYRTLDDMTQQERDALCRQYNTTISSKREPYEDAPWRLSDSFEDQRRAIKEVIDSPLVSHFVRKACAKLLNGLEYRGYLSQHQQAQLRRWQKRSTRVRSESIGVREEIPAKSSVAGSPRAPVTPSKKSSTPARKTTAKPKRKAKPKGRK